MDYWRMAVNTLRETYGQPTTHWSYYDDPEKALCGELIRPEDFNRNPTCQECARQLRLMQLEEIR